ncbi:MAG TPA: signal peptide peptidase SppA [Polyangiaceae bacterium]|jgi:protease-4
MRVSTTLGAVGLCMLVAGSVQADPLPTSAEHVATPGRSVASDDTSQAIVVNPANLAFLPAPEARWTFVYCPSDVAKVGCGHSWEAATPLFFGLATGLRVDLVQPAGNAGFPYVGSDYAWLTWALAAKLGENASFGVSFDHSYSQNAYVDNLNGITAALDWRPNTHFGFAAVARDFNRPSSALVAATAGGGPCASPNDTSGCLPVLDGRYSLAMAFRPTGRRNVDIGLEVQYWQGVDQWIPRGTVGVDIPSLGRVFASGEIGARGTLGTAGLEVHWGGLSAGGGALFGDGLGSSGTAAGYGSVAIAGYSQPGIPTPARAVWLRIEETPGTRSHVALLRKLWKLAESNDVAAVTLVLRAEPASSFAHAEELADALRVLRAHHKKVLCSLEDGGARALYVCANADRTVVSPAGGVRYAGLKAQYIYLKGLLDKIGVKAEFIRIGPHKTAPEQFTNEHAGPVAAADHEEMLHLTESVFVRNLSIYRHLSEERIREETRHGPFVAEEAKAAGFVDGFAFDDQLEQATKELTHRDIAYQKYSDETLAPSTFGSRGKIAILYLDGDIVDGRSQHIPLVDMKLVGSYSMADSIKQLREDGTVRAVVLRIESPGGSSLASDVMWRELSLLAKAKPLIVSMGSVAASGGYYVASASKDIYALPLTVTGSIGVFYGKADVSGLLGKLGVTIDTYKTAPRADAESFFRGFTPDETRELEHKVDQFYDTFLDRVSQGRGMSKEAIDAVGRGRVWTGQQALERHLVDHLGGLREALEDARSSAYLPADAPIVEYPPQSTSLLDLALKLASGSAESDHSALAAMQTLESLPPAVRAIARAVAPLLVYRTDEALARMEWVDAEQE